MTYLNDAQLIRDNFLKELQQSAKGEKNSLKFIKHHPPSQPLIKDDELFQVVVIGGSVFRKALMVKKDNKYLTIQQYEELQPEFETKEIFLQYLLEHLYEETSLVAVNFAYPLESLIRNERLDGILLSGSKENRFEGLIGLPVGVIIEKYLFEKKNKEIKVTLTNDAICLLLSGVNNFPKDSFAGAIMGTGSNMTFFFNDLAINLESGDFDKFKISESALEIDKESADPGSALFEKEVAGAYLYLQFNYYLQKEALKIKSLKSTKDLQIIALKSDNIKITTIARNLFEKSAAYFAAQIIGLVEFKKQDLKIIMEGSTYWKNPLYQQYFNKYLQALKQNFNIEIVKIENSSIIGGAKLLG